MRGWRCRDQPLQNFLLTSPLRSSSTRLLVIAQGAAGVVEVVQGDAFGPKILAVYPSHRRATGKVLAFIEYLAAYLERTGLNT